MYFVRGYNKKNSILKKIFGWCYFLIILGGSYSIVSNYERIINIQSNETVGSIANKIVFDLLR